MNLNKEKGKNMSFWSKVKNMVGLGTKPEVKTEVAVKAKPVVKKETVKEDNLPKGIVKEPKGIKKTVPKHKGLATKTATPKTAPAVEEKLKEVKKAVKAETKKTPAKKVVAKKVVAKKTVAPKAKAKGPLKSWYNNGKEQKLILNSQEIAKGWVKGRLPKKDK